ncbi:unnamed protein product [Paramecium primaurelia]|uniref:Tetratricopeptide repeat protein n=1 Tax=Paramecium primaurelia TaxID=5886 RepID=A0A8S1KBR9_PARPR|nr:unnamed protein product [Paramecium primaurelia]
MVNQSKQFMGMKIKIRRCVLINKTDNLIISGSDDLTTKFWHKQYQWNCQQTINDHKNRILVLSITEQQNKLITCSEYKSILMIESQESDRKWVVKKRIVVEQYGLRLCFINDDLFAFQPNNRQYMHTYQIQNDQIIKKSEIDFQNSPDIYSLFSQQYIQEKHLLFNKNGFYVHIIRQKDDNYFIIEQSINLGIQNFYGAVSEDGKQLITWDSLLKVIQQQNKNGNKIQKVKLQKRKKEKISVKNQQMELYDQEKNLKQKEQSKKSSLNSEKLLINRGLSLLRQRKFEESIIQFDKVIKLSPSNDEAYVNKSAALIELNQFEQGLQVAKIAIQKNPKNDEAYNKLGAALLNLNEQEEAILYFSKAINLNPKNEFAQFNMANLLRELDRPKEAIEYYNNAIKINPIDIEYYMEKAFCLQVLKKYQNAIKCFNQALSLNPNEEITQTLLMNKGYSLGCIKQFQEELNCYNSVIMINPKNKEVQKLINDLKLKINNHKKPNDHNQQHEKKQKIKQVPKKKNNI